MTNSATNPEPMTVCAASEIIEFTRRQIAGREDQLRQYTGQYKKLEQEIDKIENELSALRASAQALKRLDGAGNYLSPHPMVEVFPGEPLPHALTGDR